MDQIISNYTRNRQARIFIYEAEDYDTLSQFEQALVENSDNTLIIVHELDTAELSHINVSATCREVALSHGHLEAVFEGIQDFLSCFTLYDAAKTAGVYRPWAVREWLIRITHALVTCNETSWVTQDFVNMTLQDLNLKDPTENDALAFLQTLMSMSPGMKVEEVASQIEVKRGLFEDPVMMSININLFCFSLATLLDLRREDMLLKYAQLSNSRSIDLRQDTADSHQELRMKIFDATQSLWLSVEHSNQSNVESASKAACALHKAVDEWNRLKMMVDVMHIVYRWKSTQRLRAYDIHVGMERVSTDMWIMLDKLMLSVTNQTQSVLKALFLHVSLISDEARHRRTKKKKASVAPQNILYGRFKIAWL